MKDQVLAFFQKLKADPTLGEQVARLGQNTEGIIKLAASNGFHFDPATFERTLNGMASKTPNQELDDEELDQVAGGSWSGYWTWNAGNQTWTWTWVWNNSSSGWVAS